ncbi:hypothetical protein DM01DRAFT_1334963 [Hesseltinella vesiculosa]|uniref:Enhancer of polycomb-like protein n=1 Tax=Hesseltinella vesiculosa TaxID=101127 RepID=A0A1X2GJU5_9FUNG|nr:hypothetical protein DM01DRAFT_1334963 [Hesseltinella vesiculosa]
MSSSMVPRFRVKKLSPKHLLPVYKESQLPDFSDASYLQRDVPQIETGVEKEEEEEHDLQAAISAAQAAVATGAQVTHSIPTPDASLTIKTEVYNALYRKNFKTPFTYIRYSTTVEETMGCPYVMDEADDAFLKQFEKDHPALLLTEDHFEEIMYKLEKITNTQLPNLSVDPSQLPDYDAFQSLVQPDDPLLNEPAFEPVFEHWRKRRAKRAGQNIIPDLKYEDVIKNEVDPYVCFRHRETKSFRKIRKTDESSVHSLHRLRTDLETAKVLLEMVLRREKGLKEAIALDATIFEKKLKFREYQRALGIKEEDDTIFAPKKKRKVNDIGTTIKIPLSKLKKEKSPVQQAIDAELARRKEQDAPYEDITNYPWQPFAHRVPNMFYFHVVKGDRVQFRKRTGRNGRLYLDRIGYQPQSPSTEAERSALARFQFDSDHSDDDSEDLDEVWMQPRSLLHRAAEISENDLRLLSIQTLSQSTTPAPSPSPAAIPSQKA